MVVKSELLIVKEQNKDFIRLKKPSRVVCLQEVIFRWSAVENVICASGLVVN